jgi:tetraacyldisaccharide 4'-kinase
MVDPKLDPSALFDRALSRSSFTGEFPADRPTPPAMITAPLSWLYGIGATWYHRHYNLANAFRPPVPVISIGNLAVGGTGKTPTVIAMIKLIAARSPLLAQTNSIAVLSRGYGRRSNELIVVEQHSDYHQTGDEPLLIKRSLPDVAVVVNADRRVAARYAVEKLGAKLLLQDDGFQNRELARDLDFVCLDGGLPLGNGWTLPGGPLRERPGGLKRASAILGIGADSKAASEVAEQFGKPFVAGIPIEILPVELSTDLSTPVFVLVSIARPTRFVNMLKKKGLDIVGGRAFGDHHRFRPSELKGVSDAAALSGAKAVITTAKDRVRIDKWPGGMPLLAADVKIEFDPEATLLTLLEPVFSEAVKDLP